MGQARRFVSDVAFSESVKAEQVKNGSRAAYARMEQGDGWESEITPELFAFITEQSSFFFGTANAAGQPYIQHRGGPPGFLHVLDAHTLAFADFRGNRQYISVGNLAENPKVHLFLLDYGARQRIKIWGEARVVEDDPALLAQLTPTDYDARVERAIVVRVTAWDSNCPQHIPRLFSEAELAHALAEKDARIAELEALLRR